MLTRGPYRIGQGVAAGGALNRAHPLNVGLVGRWMVLPGRMAGPTWYDLARTYHGTFNGGVAKGPTSRPGGMGELKFDGSSGYVTFPTLTDLSFSSGTIAWYARPTTAFGDGLVDVFWSQYNGANNDDFTAQKFSDGNLYVGWSWSGFGDRIVLAATASNFRAGHYAFTWVSGGFSRLYLDGVQIGVNTGATAVKNIGVAFQVGKQGSLTNYWPGGQDDYAIYARALSPAEVAALYSLSLRGYPGLLNRSGVSSPALFGSVASTATTFSFTSTLAGVSLSAALTATAPASSALTLAPTLANVALTASFTAAAPAASAFTAAATLAGVTLASSFTSSTPGATSATLAPTLADVALASSYTATAAGGSSLSLAPTLAAATLSATLTATAPAASSFSAPATLADLTLASTFTAAAVGASAFTVAPTLADVALAASFTTATPASSSVAVSATLADLTLASTFTASAVGDSAFTVAGTIGVTLAATLATAQPAASALTYAATLADVALSALLSSTGPGSSSLALAAVMADCTASLHLTAAGGLVAAGAHPDAGRSTGVRLGPDPARSTGRRLGPDPSRSTGAVT